MLLSVPLALAIFIQPGRIFYAGLPDAGAIAEFVTWAPAAVYANWQLDGARVYRIGARHRGRPSSAGGLRPTARRQALGVALVILSAVSVAQAWQRPDLPAEYARSAFADLGPATFMAAMGLILALAAMWGTRPRGGPTRDNGLDGNRRSAPGAGLL